MWINKIVVFKMFIICLINVRHLFKTAIIIRLVFDISMKDCLGKTEVFIGGTVCLVSGFFFLCSWMFKGIQQ